MSRPPITRARPWTPSSGAFEGQTFHSERQYRNALARLHGFRSWSQQQVSAGPRVTDQREAQRLRPSEREAHQRAGGVLSDMRRDRNLSLTEAARRRHTTPAAVRRHAGDALQPRRGRYVAADRDSHYRRVAMISTEGLVWVSTRHSADATLISEHDTTVDWFLRSGDDSGLGRFQPRTVRSEGHVYRFLVDLDMLEELGRRGELSFESFYEAP